MTADGFADYWNHNTAFHREILRRCASTSGAVLDVGCGDGLLLSRLAQTGRPVVGLDPDREAAALARRRCETYDNVMVVEAGFEEGDLGQRSFGFVTMVAALHHMDTRIALARAAEVLAPGGALYVLGLTRLGSRTDVARALLSLPRARIVGAMRREHWPAGVPKVPPGQTFDEIDNDVAAVLPGARLRRRPYYRFSLEWRKPRSE